jgi:hypothetical protein
MQPVATISNNKFVELRPAPPPPTAALHRSTIRDATIRDDNELFLRFDEIEEPKDKESEFNFLTIHDYFGQSWKELIKLKLEEKEKTERPLIVF